MGIGVLLVFVGIILIMVQTVASNPIEYSNNSTAEHFINPAAETHEENSCRSPPIDHGFAGHLDAIPKKHYSPGEAINVFCNVNYRLVGPDTLECNGESWSGVAQCIPMGYCSKLPDIPNGFVHQPDKAEPNSTATFSCQPGYNIKNNQTCMCISYDGDYWTWNSTSVAACVLVLESNSDTNHEGNTVNNDCSINIALMCVFFLFVIFSIVLGIYCIKLSRKQDELQTENEKYFELLKNKKLETQCKDWQPRQPSAQDIPKMIDLAAPPSQKATDGSNSTDSIDDDKAPKTMSTSIEESSSDNKVSNVVSRSKSIRSSPQITYKQLEEERHGQGSKAVAQQKKNLCDPDLPIGRSSEQDLSDPDLTR